MSHQDRARLIQSLKMSNINEEPACDDEDELAEMFGYCNNEETVTETEEEVTNVHDTLHSSSNFSRTTETKCSYMCPVSSQILTVYQDSSNKLPLHIDLDSGATLNYCVESEVLKRGFKIHPNGQMSKLGDGVTKLKGIGEIHETFFRNNWKVQFSAIVCKTLTSPFIGGTPFLKQNGIDQDFVKNVIHVHNKQVTVQPTDPVALLPSAPLLCTAATPKVKPIKNVENSLMTYLLRFYFLDNLLIFQSNLKMELLCLLNNGSITMINPGLNLIFLSSQMVNFALVILPIIQYC